MTLLFALVVACAFFAQALMGFGGGLIATPILSLFMPIQDVVTTMIIYQFSMGLLIFKTAPVTNWQKIRQMIPSMIVGVGLGLVAIKFVPGDYIRIFLATYIVLHLLRNHTSFDPLKRLIEMGGIHFAGFLGGAINTSIGTGGPAFILYLKDIAKNTQEFRANVTAILFLSNIPRLIGLGSMDMFTPDLIKMGLIAYPGFLLALFLGQKLHDKIPQDIFLKIAECILAFSALALIIKVIL